MTNSWIIAKKELRGFFGSPVAVLFLGAFLAFTLLGFFWYHKFFARNIADARPLFELLPLAMIVLVAALAMRLWAEEQRAGTIELLLTLPVARHHLVFGKFLAGMVLVATALAMTLGVPLTIAWLGELDWGPVIGGYVAAMMLAAAYLAIGMCISAMTDNQLVALIGTTLVCLVLYLPGTTAVTQLVGLEAAGWLRSVAIGHRFESIARGVLDLRDLAYYASLTAIGLALNVYMLVRRSFGRGPGDERVRNQTQLATALVVLNALALNLWLAPVTAARADLTARREFSLSPTTEAALANLEQPLLIRAYFSDNLPTELRAHVPRILDVLEEYQVRGRGNVRLEQIDPSQSQAIADQAKRDFGIESRPFRELSKNRDSVVNAYFYVVLQQGNRRAVLDAGDFLDEKFVENALTYRLKSIEYAVTSVLRKLAATGQDLGERIRALPSPVSIVAYTTPDNLPPQFAQLPATLDLAVKQLKQELGDKVEYATISPPPGADPTAFFAAYSITPTFKNLATDKPGFFTVTVTANGRTQPLVLDGAPNLDTIRDGLRGNIRRSIPGFSKVVGIWTPPAPPAPMAPTTSAGTPSRGEATPAAAASAAARAAASAALGQAPPPPPQMFDAFARALLQSDYDLAAIRTFSPTTLQLLDVLVLAGPANLSPADAQAIDQYVMRGGSLVVLAGRYRLATEANDRIKVERVNTGLEDLFRGWGIDVAPYLVLDERNDRFPAPIGGDRIEMRPYPYFVRVEGDGLSDSHPATADVAWAVMHYASPIVAAADNGPLPARLGEIEITPLLTSSPRAWTDVDVDVHPDRAKSAATSKAALGLTPPFVLGVSLTGVFPSAATGSAAQPGAAQSLTKSPPNTHVVVIGSSAFASDELVDLLTQLDNQSGYNNLLFLQNAVDWAVRDTDMLGIRAQATRLPLLNLSPERARTWEYVNYGVALAALLATLALVWLYRRTRRPWPIAAWANAQPPNAQPATAQPATKEAP